MFLYSAYPELQSMFALKKKAERSPSGTFIPVNIFGIYLGLFLTPFQTLLPFCVIFQSVLRSEAFQRILRNFNDAVDISGKDFHFKTVALPLYFFSWDDCFAANIHTHTHQLKWAHPGTAFPPVPVPHLLWMPGLVCAAARPSESVPLYYPRACRPPLLLGKEQFPVAVCLIKC